MRFAKKTDLLINKETTNKAIVKFCSSKFENHIPAKCFSLLSPDIFIIVSNTYAFEKKSEELQFFSM